MAIKKSEEFSPPFNFVNSEVIRLRKQLRDIEESRSNALLDRAAKEEAEKLRASIRDLGEEPVC